MTWIAVVVAAVLGLPGLAVAATYPLPPADVDLVGELRVVPARHEDTLLDIARREGLGYEELVQANPGVDRWLPGAGTAILLPTRYILPRAPREGIVLNLPEMRLYYYPKPEAGQAPVVMTYPVSIGRMDWHTPLGRTSVVAKQVDPPWIPPASIKAEHAAQGDILPDIVPGGPDNPLGRYALRLGIPGYLIHSTNRPFGIGMRVTHGCVRMYPEDIERFFPMVPVGTPVTLVNQPVKSGRLAGMLFLEFHVPLDEDEVTEEMSIHEVRAELTRQLGDRVAQVDPLLFRTVVEQGSGLPVPINQ